MAVQPLRWYSIDRDLEIVEQSELTLPEALALADRYYAADKQAYDVAEDAVAATTFGLRGRDDTYLEISIHGPAHIALQAGIDGRDRYATVTSRAALAAAVSSFFSSTPDQFKEYLASLPRQDIPFARPLSVHTHVRGVAALLLFAGSGLIQMLGLRALHAGLYPAHDPNYCPVTLSGVIAMILVLFSSLFWAMLLATVLIPYETADAEPVNKSVQRAAVLLFLALIAALLPHNA